MPHELTQKILLHRINTCGSFLKRDKIDLFSKRMTTTENNNQKLSRFSRDEPAQTIANRGTMTKKSFVEYLVELERNHPL